MSQEEPVPTRYAQVEKDLLALLEPHVAYKDWATGLAQQKCFYIRGITWFKSEVLTGTGLTIHGCAAFVPKMKAILNARTSWHRKGFAWSEAFALRQFQDAASTNKRKPGKFQKAVEGIVLCETIADHLHQQDRSRPPKEAVYDRMRVEPAASYLPGFTEEVLQELLSRPQATTRLSNYTGHTTLDVFHDMTGKATGSKKCKTVTHKLVQRLYSCLLSVGVTPSQLGVPEFRYDPVHRDYLPSRHENVDVDVDLETLTMANMAQVASTN